MNKEQILEAICKLNVLEMCDLVKMMEKKFDVGLNIINQNTSTPNNEIKKEKKEQTIINIILTDKGKNKIAAIKTIRAITKLGLKEAKDAVENLPFTIKESIKKEETDKIKKQLEDIANQKMNDLNAHINQSK
jgi:large subunit ribosomal protein L7/L12